MTLLGAYLVPELWWDPQVGFSHLQALIDDAFELGVQAFQIRGGPRDAVYGLTEMLHRHAPVPLLIAMEVEAGVGARVPEMTPLPPLRALAALRDSEVIRRAALLSARQLRALGVNWALAPVADLVHPSGLFAHGAHALGDDPQRVAEDVVTWIDACQSQSVLACARHFPGIGRAISDPQVRPLRVDADARTAWETDLVPFRGAVDAGVASVLVGAVAYPRLDRAASVAAHSATLIQALLRAELVFDGLVVGDRADGAGMGGPDGAVHATVEAVRAGCDLVLACDDLSGAVAALDAAAEAGLLTPEMIEASAQRRRFWSAWATPRETREPTLEDLLWARQTADLLVHPVRGSWPELASPIDVTILSRGADAVSLQSLLQTLHAAGREVRLWDQGDASDGTTLVVALDVHREVVLVFGPPAVASLWSETTHVLCAWSADRAMQEGAARAVVAHRAP